MSGNPRIGDSLDQVLREDGLYESVKAVALKRTIVLQISAEMSAKGISKSEMARRMRTSASQLARLLDPKNERVQLDTLVKAASAVGKELSVELC
jgi:antitoxin HicB